MSENILPFIKGFKYPIYPNKEQKTLLEKTFGCCRFVWNKALAEAKESHSEHLIYNKKKKIIGIKIKSNITGFQFAQQLPSVKAKPDLVWLCEVSNVPLQQTLINLGSAYADFFKKKKGYPNFKKKHSHQSFSLTKNGFRFINNQFYIAKSKDPIAVGFGRNGKNRYLPSEPSSCAISKTPTGKYYVSFVCEYIPTKTNGTGNLGIDLGIKDFLVDSNGNKISNPKFLNQHERNLKRKQQKLSKCQKGSIRRNKARLKVAKIHETITNARNNFQHQLSRKLINENQVIGIENLIVKNMVKNRKLSKAISQVGWSSFVNKLIYKSRESQHCNIVKIDTFYPSSHICNNTQIKLDRKLKLSERDWICPYCGETHDRDINAARNIRDEAILQMVSMNIPLGGYLVLAETK